MDELLGEFVAETLEGLESLSGEVVAWESNPTDRERLDMFFRFFHTVKGSCGFLNLARLETLAHRAEDVLAAIRADERESDPATLSAVLAVMDRIGDIARALGDGTPEPAEDEDEALLLSLVEGAAPTNDDILDTRALDDAVIERLVATVVEKLDEDAPTANATHAPQGGGRERGPRTIRISLALIDQLMNAVSDMVLARNELGRKLRESHVDPDVEGSFDRLSACVADMRDMVSKTRMQRVDRLFAAIPRMVRDLSQELGKKVELVLEGGDVEMDREMIEMVLDPLTHIVRNALDHGIEPPADRLAAGKTEQGRVRISARQSGNQIVIQVTDNGRGIDAGALVAKALRLGVIAEADVATMSHEDKLNLIFHAGLSTAQQVSAISGRGVGMDVVRTNVERIGGVVMLETGVGQGTVISLRVPMTLTIIPGLILRCGSELFAIPRANVIELLHESAGMVTVENVAGARIASIRGQRYSLIDLEELLGRARDTEMATARTLMLIGSPSGVPFALGVDTVENHEELVIRPASPPIMAAGIFAGMTLPDNGRPMLLLDPAGIAQVAELPKEADREHETRATQQATAAAQAATIQALHFLECSGEARLIPLEIVERIEDIAPDQFGEAQGDRFVRLRDRLVRVANAFTAIDDEPVKVLHLRVGAHELCYVVREVVDIIDMPVKPALSVHKPGITGIVAHEGRHLEVVDAHALFAALQAVSIKASPGTCLIAGLNDDVWMRTILAPLLIQAGYEVADAAGADPEDGGPFVLLCAEDHALPRHNAAPVIRLRDDVAARGAAGTIYRYDKPALLAAITDMMGSQAA